MARTRNRYRSDKKEDKATQTYRTGIYIRLSKERTETWRNKSQSLDTQANLARIFAQEQGLSVIKCYIDYEYSGTNFSRPAFQEMMEDIKKGLINCILIRDLSRLGRDYIEMGRLIDKVFPFLGVRFISINDHLDTFKGLEEKKSFEIEIKNLVNDLYSRDISKKVMSYNIQQANKGYYIGTSAPFGYRLDKQEKGIKLVIDEVAKPVIDRIFQMALEGASSFKIAKYLNDFRFSVPKSYRKTGDIYRTSDDGKVWNAGNILRLLKSPTYRGHLYQRTRNKKLTEADYIYVENTHEAYITEEEFETISHYLSSRKSKKISNRERTPNRYQGLLYAQGKTNQLRRYCRHFKNKDYYSFIDYVHDSKGVRQPVSISELVLDKIISKLLQNEMKRIGSSEQILPRLQEKKEECINTYRSQVKKHQVAIATLHAELDNLYVSYSLSRENRKQYLSDKAEKIAKIETISQEILQCETSITNLEDEYHRQVNWLNELEKCHSGATLSADLLNALIDRIEVDVNKIVTVTFACQIGGVEHV